MAEPRYEGDVNVVGDERIATAEVPQQNELEQQNEDGHSNPVCWSPPDDPDKHNIEGLLTSLKSIAENLREQEQFSKENALETAPAAAPEVDDLPISPLEKVMKRLKKRSQPKRQPTQVEKEKLANNPWAAMLASPLRVDAASKIRFPTALLVELGQVVNPDDKQVYMMPDDLADLKTFKQKLSERSRKYAMRGSSLPNEKSRMLPYKLLVEDLTDYCMAWDTNANISRTKRGAVSKRLVSGKSLEKAQKVAAFQNASKEYWDLREKQGELDDALFKRPQKGFDYIKLQWLPSIAERIPDIMRQRVLLALSYVMQKQYQLPDSSRIYTLCLPWPETHLLDLDSLPKATIASLGKEDFWNDMGDIESADAIVGGSSRQGNRSDPRPPIAVQASEIREEAEEEPNPFNKDDPRIWVPGSFLLHVGPPETTLKAVPDINGSTTESSTNFSSSSQFSKYIPPMLTINLSSSNTEPDIHRLPVFNLPALLGPKLYTTLPKLLQKYQHLPPTSRKSSADLSFNNNQNFVILVKSVSPGSHFLAQELWQLWRYLGGRDCLQSQGTDRSQDEIANGSAQPARAQRGRSDYQGLSAAAWANLHELLELNVQ